MNKKLITTLIAASILVILFSTNISASIFATIGMKGLSFADPNAAKAVQTVVCASNPAACAAGYVTGQVSGEVIGEVAKQSPQAVKAIQQYNQVNGWVKEGAQINEDLKLNEKGEMAGGKILLTGDKPRDVSKLVGEGEEKGSVMAANMEVSSKREGGPVTFTAKGDYGRVEVDKKYYSNMQEDSTIEVCGGSMCKADITTNGGTYEFPNDFTHQWQSVQAKEKGTIVTYNQDGNFEINVDRKEKNIPVNVQVDDNKFYIEKGSSIEVKNQAEGKETTTKVTGEDFTTDNRRFTGKEGQLAEITMSERKEGQVLGKNTIAEDKEIDLIVETSEENTMFSKACQDILGYYNYVSSCGSKMNSQGDGLYIEIEEGNNFGLTMETNDIMEYELEGGELIIDNGEQTIIPDEEGFIYVTNGEIETNYIKADRITEGLMNPDSIGKKPQVSASTKYDEVVVLTEDGIGEEVYVCPQEEITGAAVTGAFKVPDVPQMVHDVCQKAIDVGKRGLNRFFTTEKRAFKGLFVEEKEIFAGQFVIEESEVTEYKRPDGTIMYNRIFTTQDNNKFSVYSDGSVTKWNEETRKWEELDYTFDKKDIDYLQVGRQPAAKTTVPAIAPSESGAKTSMLGDVGKGVDEAEIQNSIAKGDLKEDEFFVGGAEKGGYVYLTGAKGSRIKSAERLMEIVKDPATGQVQEYRSLFDDKVYVPIGGGKVKLKSR